LFVWNITFGLEVNIGARSSFQSEFKRKCEAAFMMSGRDFDAMITQPPDENVDLIPEFDGLQHPPRRSLVPESPQSSVPWE
jgi:hypothetical protein